MPIFYSNSVVSDLKDGTTSLPNIRNANKYASHPVTSSTSLSLDLSDAADSIYVLAEGVSAISPSPAPTGNLFDVGNNVKAYFGKGSFSAGSDTVNVNFTGTGNVFQVLVMNEELVLSQTNDRAITSYETTRSIRDSYVQEDLYGVRTLQSGSSRGAKRSITYTIWQSGSGVTESSSGAITVPYDPDPNPGAIQVSVTLSGGMINSNPVSDNNPLRVIIAGTNSSDIGFSETLIFTSNTTLTTSNYFKTITSASPSSGLSFATQSRITSGPISDARNKLSELYDIQRKYPNFILRDLNEGGAQDYRSIFPAYWIPDSFSENIQGNQVISYSFAVEER